MTVIAKRVPLIQPTKEFSHSKESPSADDRGRKCSTKTRRYWGFARSMMVRTKNSNKPRTMASELLSKTKVAQQQSYPSLKLLRRFSDYGTVLTLALESQIVASRTKHAVVQTCGKILNNCCNCSTMRGTITAKKPMMRASNTTTVMAMAILRLIRYR